MNIRALGVQYLKEHPQRFIESNTKIPGLSIEQICHNKVHGVMTSLFKFPQKQKKLNN